jgi:hypothetical protein
VKFKVEVRRGSDVIHSSAIEVIASWRARRQAEATFPKWKKRGADSARLFNAHDQELFSWTL